MIRKLLATALVAVAIFAVAPSTAQAERLPSARVAMKQTTLHQYPLHAIPKTVGGYPVCVTASWWSKFLHRPMTKRGQKCALVNHMWVPKSWRLVGYVGDVNGAARYDVWDAVIALAR